MTRGIDAIPAMPHTKRTRRGIISTTIICLSLLIYWNAHAAFQSLQLQVFDQPDQEPKPPAPPCRGLKGAEDTVVILRTGSTELDDRFRVHLSTTTLCYAHFLVFSDLEEDYHGEHILDALSTVDDDIRTNHPDFDIYRRIQTQGRAALNASELGGSPEAFERMGGNAENPGWKLDKWKFMPMLNRTIHEYPDKKWYVFIEADSFLIWSMLLQYLSLLDPTEPYYIGSGSCMGEDLFAHGGSGFVASQPAMLLATQHYAANRAQIETLTDQQWAGDYVLGKSFNDAGVSTTDAWPHFQGDYPGLVAYAGPDGRYGTVGLPREWCAPTISYHHMSSDMIEGLWNFEQQWISAYENVSLALERLRRRAEKRLMTGPQSSDTLRHGDVFKEYVMPQMMDGKADWDNLSDEDAAEVDNVDECRARCDANPDCKQYLFVQEIGQCKTRVDPRLGKPAEGIQSGWIEDRVLNFAHKMPACGDEGWQVGAATRHTQCK
jgi:hypothetical protein